MANANPNPANVPVLEASAPTYYSRLQNALGVVGAAGTSIRNRALFPAGRWLRNVGGPRTRNALGTGATALRNRAFYPAGRWVRNVGVPRARNALGTSAIALRNRGLYPAGRYIRNVGAPAVANFTRRCIGAACRQGAAAAASLGFNIDLNAGLAITARDRAVMGSLPAAQGSPQFTAFKLAELENDLNERINNYLLDNPDIGNEDGGLTVDDYKSLMPRYARDLKTLYMMKLTSMGIDRSEIVSLSNNTATGILMQIHLLRTNEAGNHQVEYNRFTGAQLQPLLDELSGDDLSSGAFFENENENENEGESKSTSGGKRRSTRRRRNRRSTRRT